MRSLPSFAFAAVLAAPFAGPALADDAKEAPKKPEPKLEFVYVEMTGAEGDEVAVVARRVGAVDGVKSFAWTVEGKEAKVVREVGKAADEALVKAAKDAGAETAGLVPVAVTTFTFEKKLHCGGCVAAVDKAVRAMKGVKESWVPAEMTTVSVVYDTRVVKPSDVEATLAAIKKPAKAPTN